MRRILPFFLFLLYPASLVAVDVTEKLRIGGSLTFVYQSLEMVSGEINGSKNRDRGSLVLDFNISYSPFRDSELFLRASFAKGSGFNEEKSGYPFALRCNADDLSSDLHNINGRSRDNLQEAWFSKKFELRSVGSFKMTGGIIDSSAFIDDNSYAGDELSQFMNETFVRNPLANLPSYDLGFALEMERGPLRLKALAMGSKNQNEQMAKKDYLWIGSEIGLEIKSAFGTGNYRFYAYTTNRKFENWTGSCEKRLKGFGTSIDQEIKREAFGFFIRAGWQDDSARIDYERMISGGVSINGNLWGRKGDGAGIGYAYLTAPFRNPDIKSTEVIEAYVRFELISYKFLSSDLTFDYQRLKDRARPLGGTKLANIYGVRMNLNF